MKPRTLAMTKDARARVRNTTSQVQGTGKYAKAFATLRQDTHVRGYVHVANVARLHEKDLVAVAVAPRVRKHAVLQQHVHESERSKAEPFTFI